LKLFINFCFQILLKTANNCCQTERQIHGALYTQHGGAQQCLNANCLQMIQKKQQLPNSPNLNPLQISYLGERCMKLLWKLHLKPKQFLN